MGNIKPQNFIKLFHTKKLSCISHVSQSFSLTCHLFSQLLEGRIVWRRMYGEVLIQSGYLLHSKLSLGMELWESLLLPCCQGTASRHWSSRVAYIVVMCVCLYSVCVCITRLYNIYVVVLRVVNGCPLQFVTALVILFIALYIFVLKL